MTIAICGRYLLILTCWILSTTAMLANSSFISDGAIDVFRSEKELKEMVHASEWREFKVNGKRFLVGIVPLLSAGSSHEMVACWQADPRSGKLLIVWSMRFREIGPASLEFDASTTVVSVVGLANTKFKGLVVASVNLSAL